MRICSPPGAAPPRLTARVRKQALLVLPLLTNHSSWDIPGWISRKFVLDGEMLHLPLAPRHFWGRFGGKRRWERAPIKGGKTPNHPRRDVLMFFPPSCSSPGHQKLETAAKKDLNWVLERQHRQQPGRGVGTFGCCAAPGEAGGWQQAPSALDFCNLREICSAFYHLVRYSSPERLNLHHQEPAWRVRRFPRLVKVSSW